MKGYQAGELKKMQDEQDKSIEELWQARDKLGQ
jgi:hypothetical protein